MADDLSLIPPPGARADWTIDQGWERYSQAEHDVWITLYERQAKLLTGRACDPFLKGLDALDLHRAGIPDFNRINEELTRLTGWSVVAVPGLVPDAVFFDNLFKGLADACFTVPSAPENLEPTPHGSRNSIGFGPVIAGHAR